MRPLLLALALPLLAGCLFDCDFPDYGTERSFLVARAAAAPTDTLVVRVELGDWVAETVSVYVPAGGVPVVTTDGSVARVRAQATLRDYEPIRAVRLDASAAADTLVVTVTRESLAALSRPTCGGADGLIRPVCSPAPSEAEVLIESVTAPEGVRAVRVVYDDPRRGPGLAARARPTLG